MTADKSETRNQKSEGSQKSERRTVGCRNVRITKHLRHFARLLPEACDDRVMARESEARNQKSDPVPERGVSAASSASNFCVFCVFCGKKSYP